MSHKRKERKERKEHMASVREYEFNNPDGDVLLYVSRPGDGRVRYVWTSGTRVGLAASEHHLNTLLRKSTLTTKQLAYGDQTDCSNCDYSSYYSIGD